MSCILNVSCFADCSCFNNLLCLERRICLERIKVVSSYFIFFGNLLGLGNLSFEIGKTGVRCE